jgi:hypothetical protein
MEDPNPWTRDEHDKRGLDIVARFRVSRPAL